MEATDKELIIHPDNLRAFILKCLQSVGTLKQQAEDLTELLVSADQRGHYSHGVNRLDFYLSDITNGLTCVDKEPEVIKETVSTALVEGNNCLGPVVGKYCIDIAIQKAKTTGIGWVSARGSNHFGIAGWYSIRAMQQGLIGMAFCNTSPNMIPTRAKKMTLGTNPISVAAKGNNNEDFVLDMATTAVAQGKVEIKRCLGQSVPVGWGLDRNGKPTTDTEEVLYHGGLNPLGGLEETSGYKGYGLAFMVELFCGILSGSTFGTNVRHWAGHSSPADLGQCFVAIDPKAFAPGFETRLSTLIHQCKDQEPAEGNTEILVPGEPEKIHIKLCETLGGIPYHPNQIDYVDSIAEKYGIEKLVRY
uniref:Malate dehydrogenase n=1 Tax=Biomphalaria glabrata TaxID=6526 RepID=A0A2C9KQK3_BIOGL